MALLIGNITQRVVYRHAIMKGFPWTTILQQKIPTQ